MASYFIDYYIKPYCRMGPYLMGMITGYFLYKTECKVKMNKVGNRVNEYILTYKLRLFSELSLD